MLVRDLSIRRDLEFESFVKKLGIEGRNNDIQRLRNYGRQKLLESSPKALRKLFPDLWTEYVGHSKTMEEHRRKILTPILDEKFSIVDLENTIAGELEKIEGKGFAFRSHQIDGLEKISAFFAESGKRSGYIKLPTGMGKTILFSALIRVFCSKNPETRVLILSPKDIVNTQNIKSIHRLQTQDVITGITQDGTNYRIEVANDGAGDTVKYIQHDHPNALVSTYQLLATSRRDDKRLGEFDVIILDELHKSFGTRTVEELKARYPDAIFIGLSATPYLGDPGSKNPKRAEEHIGECIMSIALPDAIESGALAPVRGFLVHTRGEEIDKLIQSGEDVNDSEYEDKIDKPQRTQIALAILKRYQLPNSNQISRKALVYCAGIDHTEETYNTFVSAGLRAARVHSRMSRKEIDQVIEGYKLGTYDIICNSDMLIEGFDNDSVSLLINIRPTRSLTNFEQMIGRAIRLDEENPGKISDIYNVTGIHSEEYTIYGLAKYYRKLQDNPMNGGLVFPTKLSDVEHKIQGYEKTEVLPSWTNEEIVLLKQYFPDWYSFFVAVNRDNLTCPGKGNIIQSSENVRFDMPDIIQTESVEKIFFPMDFEYFENMEFLRTDYENWIVACGGEALPISHSDIRFMVTSANEMNMLQYLKRLQKNSRELDGLTSQQCLFWLEEKLGKNQDSNSQKRVMNRRYIANKQFLRDDYENFLREGKGGGLDAIEMAIGRTIFTVETRRFSYNSCKDTISLRKYLSILSWTRGIDSSDEESFLWWMEQIGVTIHPVNNVYLVDIKNLEADFQNALGGSNTSLETEADVVSFLRNRRNRLFITKGGVYIRVSTYIQAIVENNTSEGSTPTEYDALAWWITKVGRVFIRSADFLDPEKVQEVKMANGLTPEYLEQMRRNIPHTFTKTIKELRADIDNLLDKSMSLGDVYFDNIDNLKYDWGTINGVLGRKITSNDIYSNLEFSTKAGIKLSISKYFDAIQTKTRGSRLSVIPWLRERAGDADNTIDKKRMPINNQYFLQTGLVGLDYAAIASGNKEEGRYIFTTQFGGDISINAYMSWIETSIPEMRGTPKDVRMKWWKEQSVLLHSGNEMNSVYFTLVNLRKDYESLRLINRGKAITYNKNSIGLKFHCQNNENGSEGISLETYISRLKIYVTECANQTPVEILKFWKEKIK